MRAQHDFLLVVTIAVALGCGGKSSPRARHDAGHGAPDSGAGDGGQMDGAIGHAGEDASQPDPQATGHYEAEDAFSAGGGVIKAERGGYSGTGYVDALAAKGARLLFAVNVSAAGTSKVSLHYAGDDKQLVIYVNGARASEISLGRADTFATHEDMLSLRAGLNTIAYVNEQADGAALSVDLLELADDAARPERGPIVPFVELEAEDGEGNGTPVGPDITAGTVAANASGRRALLLDAAGKYVEWTSPVAGNGLTLRFSLPDGPSGGGTQGTLSLYVNGKKRQVLALSSRRAWLYGAFDNNLGFSNDPSQGGALMPFIEERFAVEDIEKGAKVRLARDADDTGDVTVDLIDLEPVPEPYAAPANAISIADHGATAGDDQDDSQALIDAIAAAKSSSGVVFIPKGEYQLFQRIDLDHVTVRGAGPFYSVLHGKDGHGGFNGTGDGVQLLDFAFIGDMDHRDNANYHAGVDGKVGQGSLLQNLWIQATKVGIWLVESDGAYVVGSRIRDTYADGINFNVNVTHSAADHMHVRNTGDDGLAMWAVGAASDQNRFKYDAVHSPFHANGIALYGGTNQRVEDCEVYDTVRNSAGFKVSTEFNSIPFGGAPNLQRIALVRTGGVDLPNANSFGALFFTVHDLGIDAPISVRDLDVVDSSFDAVLFADTNPVKQVRFERVKIQGAGGYGIHIETPGDGTFTDVSVSNASMGGALISDQFTLTKSANQGW